MNTKIKLIIFDSYGVVLFGGYPQTCRYLAKKYRQNWKHLYEIIYVKYFNQAAERKITQQLAWKMAIAETGLPLSVAEIKKIHYRFMGLNYRVIKIVRQLQQHFQAALLTKNTRSQLADALRLFPELKRVFGRHLINTWEYGLPKASQETINFVSRRYRVKLQEIVYIDDQKQNLAPAKAMGVKTIFYRNFNQFRHELSHYLNYAG